MITPGPAYYIWVATGGEKPAIKMLTYRQFNEGYSRLKPDGSVTHHSYSDDDVWEFRHDTITVLQNPQTILTEHKNMYSIPLRGGPMDGAKFCLSGYAPESIQVDAPGPISEHETKGKRKFVDKPPHVYLLTLVNPTTGSNVWLDNDQTPPIPEYWHSSKPSDLQIDDG